jgi:hypothetical protein
LHVWIPPLDIPSGTDYQVRIEGWTGQQGYEGLSGEFLLRGGDLNLDGSVDAVDEVIIAGMVSEILSEAEFDPELSDLDGDGRLTILDLLLIARWLAA